MRLDFTGKRALITGGARGIGAAIAGDLAGANCKLLLLDKEEEALRQTVAALREKGAAVESLAVDLTNRDETLAAVAKSIEQSGPCQILIHNAGITKDNLLMRMSDIEWDLVLKVNLHPVYYLTKELIKGMMKERYGRIIAISSVVGMMGNPGQTNYAASKAAIIGFVKSLARELGSRNVTVNAIAPGFIRTAMTEKLQGDQIEKLKEAIALRRLGEAEDIAHAAAFLASDYASYITGNVLNVSGGLYM
ncbi:MAG: 3-oxoacyl-[acyl-carrier-protein] reductase [Acidobacteriota bacterium]